MKLIIWFNVRWTITKRPLMDLDNQSKPRLRKKRQFWRNVFIYLISLALLSIAALICLYFYMESQLPDVRKLKDIRLQAPMKILDSNGGLIAEFGEKRRIPLRFDQIPKPLIDAVLATEDARFYEHPGVDPIGLARAALVVLKSGRKAQGASTITMQVARNFYLTREKTFSRKLREILLALKIDQTFSKDTILSMYLNKIFFGNRAYGVGAAADVYYGKQLHELSLAQMAMLAGLPQSPSRNNPIRNPDSARERRNHVLERMYELHKVSHEEYEQAINEPVTASYHYKKIDLHADYVASFIRQQMLEKFGENIYEMDLTVQTTINPTIQRAARNALEQGLIDYSLRHGYWGPEGHVDTIQTTDFGSTFQPFIKLKRLPLGVVAAVENDHIIVITADYGPVYIDWRGLNWARRHLKGNALGPFPRKPSEVAQIGDIVRIQKQGASWRLAQWPKVQGAVVVLDPKTSHVLALVGGFNYEKSPFNRAIQAWRQPGSSFKPFIYSAALDKGFTLASIINDAPIVQEDSGENALWRPMNDTKKFYGPTTLREGLVKSLNLVSIRLLQQIGIHYTLSYLEKFGFKSSELVHTLSLALGTSETTPYQLARAYNVFASGGYLRDNQIVLSYSYNGGNLEQPTTLPDCSITNEENCLPPSITPQNDYLMTLALQDVIQHGTGRAARVLQRQDIAGKTGTTNDQADAWFAGYNQDIVAVVWVGYDNLRSLKEHGAQAALPIWIDLMKKALSGKSENELSQPPGIVTIRINKTTGLPTDSNDSSALFESFRSEYAPKTDENEEAQNKPGELDDSGHDDSEAPIF